MFPAMMRINFLVFYLVLFSFCCAQKPPIDTTCFDRWPAVGWSDISNNGEYLFYNREYPSLHSHVLVVRSTRSDWSIELSNAYSPRFASNNEMLTCILPGDSLAIIQLGSFARECIPHIRSYDLYPNGDKNNWLIYRTMDSTSLLFVRNLNTGKQSTYASVDRYFVSADGRKMALVINSAKDVYHQELKWVNLSDASEVTIWKGRRIKNVLVNNDDSYMAFVTADSINGQISNAVWHYKMAEQKAVRIIGDESKELEGKYTINDVFRFSSNPNRLFIRLDSIKPSPVKSGNVELWIWSYLDPAFPSERVPTSDTYTASIEMSTGKVVKLQTENQKIIFPSDEQGQDDWLLLAEEGKGPPQEWKWNRLTFSRLFMISSQTGEKRPIPGVSSYSHVLPLFSSLGKYVVFYLPEKRSYFSYNVATQLTCNLTKKINAVWTPFHAEGSPGEKFTVEQFPKWFQDDRALLLFDQSYIWKVDPLGKMDPVNLTSRPGNSKNLTFKLAFGDQQLNESDDTFIASGFDRSTKEDGFYEISLKSRKQPKRLIGGRYQYNGPNHLPNILKAKDTSIYLFNRMSDKEAPNLFLTRDFKTFSQLTFLAPQKSYNWLDAELFHWKNFEGQLSEGILYKPENFDPLKKYPLIVFVYEKFSDDLYKFTPPGMNGATIDIPYFVSNGYLVFKPDIYYRRGETGANAFNCVVSAAQQLAKLPFVDARNMGIQGHSFGGYEVNYIVTHTGLFKAALSAAGVSDLVGGIGEFNGGISTLNFMETSQLRLGATLWDRPDLFIGNSPIFNADKVITPLLLMHNRKDNNVPFRQGLALFMALRRLGKKAWLLEYGGANSHALTQKEAAYDYFVRNKEFFDHYLKGEKAPVWMTQSVTEDQIANKEDLKKDTEIKTPGVGLRLDGH